MFKTVLILIGLAILGVLLAASIRSDEFKVQRSATIAAPAMDVFNQVNDLHKMNKWSPWVKMDPAIKQIYEGTEAGIGASYSWAGNKNVGEGRMTILESRPTLVRIKLEFFKPFKAVKTTDFIFKSEGDSTVITWKMYGRNNFLSKVMSLFVNCDKMVGSQFEKGLANLKTMLETKVKA